MFPLTCSITEKRAVADDIMIITLEGQTSFSFQAGQYALLSFAEEETFLKPYSVANAPHRNTLEFHFKDSHTSEGFSHRIMREKQDGDKIILHGINGSMVFSNSRQRPIVFLAGGVGIAPFKAMLESLEKISMPLSVFWGCNTADEMYLKDFFDTQKEKHPLLSVTYCLAQENNPSFFKGFAVDAVLDIFDTVSDHDVYLAGPPAMVHYSVEKLKNKGLSQENLFCDYKIDF